MTTSPLIEALGTAPTPEALEQFWAQAEAEGTPLLEPIEGEPDHLLVTFLYRAIAPVSSVMLVGGPSSTDHDRAQLEQLPDTDLWYKSFRMRRDGRFGYSLAPGVTRRAWLGLEPLPKAAIDPFNRFPYPAENPFQSRVTLPDAPPLTWSEPQPDAPKGQLQRHTLASKILGNERTITVHLPPGYDSEAEEYRLLILFDGSAYEEILPAPTILENLLAAGKIPPLVTVLVGNPDQVTRNRELPCHAPFADFLSTELLPWITSQFRVTAAPAGRILAGSSYGALAALYAAFRRPDLFGCVLSQSASVWYSPEGDEEPEWLVRQFAAAERLPLRIYMDVGLLETRPVPTAHVDGPSQRAANRHLRNVLRAKDYPLTYREYHGGHDYVCWQQTLVDGLLALLVH